MFGRIADPCEELLQQLQARRMLANYYMTALIRLSPDAPNALQRRRELNKKIASARLHLKQAERQLQGC